MWTPFVIVLPLLFSACVTSHPNIYVKSIGLAIDSTRPLQFVSERAENDPVESFIYRDKIIEACLKEAARNKLETALRGKACPTCYTVNINATVVRRTQTVYESSGPMFERSRCHRNLYGRVSCFSYGGPGYYEFAQDREYYDKRGIFSVSDKDKTSGKQIEIRNITVSYLTLDRDMNEQSIEFLCRGFVTGLFKDLEQDIEITPLAEVHPPHLN